ncbi:MAG TPA: oligopeptide/dipeptide ABC transporter ATP-binding protein [Candidatus Ozemobacteraceae bacterium]
MNPSEQPLAALTAGIAGGAGAGIAAAAAAGVVHSTTGRTVAPLLTVAGLCKSFELERPLTARIRDWWTGNPAPRLHALSEVSFEIGHQETVGILGESGSGKSTLARVLMGLYPPDTGTAVLQGRSLFAGDRTARFENLRQMQMIFQDPFSSLDPRMSVRRILEEPLRIHGLGARAEWHDRLRRGLSEVGLDQDVLERYPSEFSGGQRQRIGICRALILDPLLLIADEAVSALDVSVQAQILELLRQLKQARGISLLFISHDIAVVRQIADRILVLYQGRIVETLPAECLLQDACHPYTRRLLGAALHLREDAALPAGQDGLTGGNAGYRDGCSCRDSCEAASKACEQMPPLSELHPGHFVACHRYATSGLGRGPAAG